MQIICLDYNSQEMSSLIFSEKKQQNKQKLLNTICNNSKWCFKSSQFFFTVTILYSYFNDIVSRFHFHHLYVKIMISMKLI